MNERIKELAEQARYISRNEKHHLERVHNREITLDEYQEIYDKKFAESIVRECLKEIKDMIVDESEQLYPNNKQTTECVNDRLMDAYDNIAELFGVEE